MLKGVFYTSEFEYYWEKAEALATMCHNQSMFLVEYAVNPVSTPRTLTEKEAELDEYFRKYGTSKLQY